MTPPSVLLDLGFLHALAHLDDDQHQAASDCYTRLLDQYETNAIRLRARADHLAAVNRKQHAELLAPIEAIHVARQYRRQAARLHQTYPPDLAVTLVVMRRESIARIATFDQFFGTIDVTVEVAAEA
jgi:predicted nucleic acid-binding protein